MKRLLVAFILLILSGITAGSQASDCNAYYPMHPYLDYNPTKEANSWLFPNMPSKPRGSAYSSVYKNLSQMMRFGQPPAKKKEGDETVAIVHYEATDSIIFDAKNNILSLQGNSVLDYSNMNLKAYAIALNLNTHMLTAEGTKDPHNQSVGAPVFTYKDIKKDKYGVEGSPTTRTFFMEKIQYNIYTKRALAHQLLTKQTDAIVKSEQVKKENETTFYTQDSVYTTCALPHPHFYIRAKRAKMVHDKQFTSGFFQFYFDDVPTPLGSFFGILFLEGKRKHGVLPGEMLVEDEYGRGFGLKNVGYYISFNDYADFQITGSIYGNGSRNFKPQLGYKKRYAYNGEMSYEQQHGGSTQGDKVGRELIWRHCTNATSHENHTININIQYKSEDYDPESPKEGKQTSDTKAQHSSVTYHGKYGPYSLDIPLKYDNTDHAYLPPVEVTSTSTSTSTSKDKLEHGRSKKVTLPVSLSTDWYPFQSGLSRGRPSWLREICLQHKVEFQSIFTNLKKDPNKDRPSNSIYSEIVPSSSLEYSKYGLKQSIVLKTDFKLFDHITLAPNCQHELAYYGKKLKYVDYAENFIEQPGHYLVDQFSFGAKLDFTLQHTHSFQPEQLVQAFRIYTIPSLDFRCMPNMSRNHKHFHQVEGEKRKKHLFEECIPEISLEEDRTVAKLAFKLHNRVDLKVKEEIDPNKKEKEQQRTSRTIALLKNLDFTTKMDLNDPDHWLQDIDMDIASEAQIWKMLRITFGLKVAFDPYLYKEESFEHSAIQNDCIRRVCTNTFAWTQGNYFGEVKSSSLRIGLDLDPKDRSEEQNKQKKTLLSDVMNTLEEKDAPVDFDKPWHFDCAFNWKHDREKYYNRNSSPYKKEQYITFNGEAQLLKKWRLIAKTIYDFKAKAWKLDATELTVKRDLHCFELSYTINPLVDTMDKAKQYKYKFSLSFRANALKALKFPRNRTFNTLQYKKSTSNPF